MPVPPVPPVVAALPPLANLLRQEPRPVPVVAVLFVGVLEVFAVEAEGWLLVEGKVQLLMLLVAELVTADAEL